MSNKEIKQAQEDKKLAEERELRLAREIAIICIVRNISL